jgi:hypothetical protein
LIFAGKAYINPRPVTPRSKVGRTLAFMKIPLSRLALISLSFVFLLTPSVISAPEPEGTSVNGNFEIFLDKGFKRHIEFHAIRDLNGKVSGETVFRDDGPQTPVDKSSDVLNADANKPFFLKAEFDCLTIEGNKAVMSGAVTEATSEIYVGRRVLVVAQENGGSDDPAKRDKLTWGFYRTQKNDWLAVDSERPDENTGQSWLATDSERNEDEGIPSNKEEVIGCQSFPISAFSFINANQGRGTVHLKR